MATNDREKIHHELLDALYDARKHVEYLERALAHNAAFLGVGVERDSDPALFAGGAPGSPGAAQNVPPDRERRQSPLPDALARYLDLVEPEEDISDYIGREGHDESRPKLGEDAPEELRPDKQPRIDSRVVLLAMDHPEDSITFGSPGAVVETTPTDAFVGLDQAPPYTPPPPVAPTGEPAPESNYQPPAPSPAPPPVAARRENESDTLLDTLSGDVCARACLVMRTINDGVWDWNILHESVYCSPRWCAITGVKPPQGDTPALEHLTTGMHKSDAELVRQHVKQIFDGKMANARVTVRFERGLSIVWAVLRLASLRNEHGMARLTAVLSDITALRHAELALRASDEKFLAMTDDSAALITRFDRDGIITHISANVSRYNTGSPADFVGKSFADTGISGDLGYFDRTVRRVFTTGQPAQSEMLFTSPLTGEFLGDCRFWPEFGVDGEVISVSVMIRNMTYSRRVAENYYALFNRMKDGFILFEQISGWENGEPAGDPEDFALVVMNPAFSQMLQMRPPESSGIRLSDLMGPAAALWADILRQVLTEERAVSRSLRTPGGGSYDISAYSPEQGRVACIVKDVTELSRITQEIRLNEARLATLYRLSHMDEAPEVAVVRYSLEQAVKLTGSVFGFMYLAPPSDPAPGEPAARVYWSESMRERPQGPPATAPESLPWLMDGLKEELRIARVVNASDDFFFRAFGNIGEVHSYMLAPVLEDGRIVCFAGVANKNTPYTTADLQQLELFLSGMWFHLRRRWAVQDLRTAKDQAEAASRAKNEFLANVSHELRTPLNGILGMLQMLQQDNLTREQTEYIGAANFSGRSLLRIISDILDFSRIEAGRFSLDSQLFDFAATVRSTTGMFFYQAERKNLRFTLHMDPAIPPLLLGDDARVRQIIFNIVGNAFKFTSEGRIIVDCELLPHCTPGMCCIHISVTDTGMGIPKEKLGEIFQEFTQIDASSTRKISGTGLGLAIVRRLVDLMGGSISVESEVGRGTTVHCSLPFALPTAISAEEPSGIEEAGEEKPMRILIAEDDPVSQFTLTAFMKRTKHTVVLVPDGRQALEALQLEPFDCLLTDIQMPVMDGMELVRRIREDECLDIAPGDEVKQLLGLSGQAASPRRAIPTDMPVVALTAYAMEGDRERFLGMGMDYYLAKPVSFAELKAVLDRIGTIVHARKQP